MGKGPEDQVFAYTNTPPESIPHSPDRLSQEKGTLPQKDLIYGVEGHQDPGPVGPAIATFWKRRSDGVTLDDIATQPSVYDDDSLAKHYQPHPEYENLHRFDPKERWTWREELPLIRRMDWKVTAWAAIAFFALDLPRGNISQANSDNFLDDMSLDTNDFNTGQTIFRVCFLAAELPSQLISKKIGPDVWIPAQMIMWSLVSGSQFWLNSRATFFTCRALIGLLQGGFIPDLILYMSYFFKGTELPFRLALFWMANRMTDVVAPLLAYGLLRLRGLHGREGWRWLFLIEGILTLCIGIWSIFQMAPSPTQTKRWWRPKGWFNEREEKIMINRILRDDPGKGDMHNRQGITLKMMWKSLKDIDLIPIYIIGLTFGMPSGPPDQYLTLTLRRIGFDTFETNLLSIPSQVGTTINMLIMTYVSERIRQRAYLGIFAQLWMIPCVIALRAMPISQEANPWRIYAITTVLLSFPTPHPIHVGWCSRISGAVRTRTVSAAVYNMAVQVQSIISSNIYREGDLPDYTRGNTALIAVGCWNILAYILMRCYYVWRNKSKERKWQQLTPEEQATYHETTTAEGNQRLDYRFVY